MCFDHDLKAILVCFKNLLFDRSSELSDSETKAALDLLRLQKTVDAMKGERRPSTNAKFFWDDVNSNPTISSESDGV